MQAEILDAVVQGVHREVAAFSIFFDSAVDIIPQQHTFIRTAGNMLAGIHLVMVTAEGCNFDDITPEHHMGEAETTTDQTAVGEQTLDLLRGGVGDDIEVFGLFSQQQVTDTAPDQVGVIA